MRLICTFLLVLAGVAAADWWVVLPRAKQALAVRADGEALAERKELPRFAARRLSPDGTAWTCIDDGFYVGKVAGGEPVRFRGKLAMSGQPAFTPDGRRVLYITKDGRTWQVASMGLDGGDVRIERALPARSRKPDVSPDGTRVAYHVEGEGWGKGTRDNFFVMDIVSGKPTRIGERGYIGGFAWSPDGKRIAVATEKSVSLYDVSGKRLRAAAYAAIDQRLYAHAGRFLLWRPDGKEVACRISFLGGRAAMPGHGPKPIYGDHELFFVPVAGAVRTVTVPRDAWVKPVAWTRD